MCIVGQSEHGSRGSYIPISAMLGNLNSLFHRIVTAAEHPHLSIPKTEVGKNRKQYHRLHVPETEDENQRKLYHRLVNQTLMFVSGISVFGLTCWLFIKFLLALFDFCISWFMCSTYLVAYFILIFHGVLSLVILKWCVTVVHTCFSILHVQFHVLLICGMTRWIEVVCSLCNLFLDVIILQLERHWRSLGWELVGLHGRISKYMVKIQMFFLNTNVFVKITFQLVKFVRRQTNIVAHTLARATCP